MSYKQIKREMNALLPAAVADYIPDGHIAKFIVETVDKLDLRKLTSGYSGRGVEAYHPSVLLSLIIYCYIMGIFSSRAMERETYNSFPAAYICDNQHPDHTTISEFRRKCLPEFKGYFLQILELAFGAGLEQIGNIYIDGSKVKANASKHKAYSYKRAVEIRNLLENEIEELFAKAQKSEESDNLTIPVTQIPEEIGRRIIKLQRVMGAIKDIEERHAVSNDAVMAERKTKQKECEIADVPDANKGSARQTPVAISSIPDPKAQINLTDPDSRIMLSRSKGFVQAYNSQICVDAESRLIIEAHVTQKASDVQEIEPALGGIAILPNSVGEPNTLTGDAGYYSEYNVKLCLNNGIEPYFATGRDKHHKGLQERFGHLPDLPDNASTKEKMAHKLKTSEGKEIYSKRKSVVEPIFGIIKDAIGFDRFSLRSLFKVTGEWNLATMAYNIKRLYSIFKGVMPSQAKNGMNTLPLQDNSC
jgi:transposase